MLVLLLPVPDAWWWLLPLSLWPRLCAAPEAPPPLESPVTLWLAPGFQLNKPALLPLSLPAMLAAMLFMRGPAFLMRLNMLLAMLCARTPFFMSACTHTERRQNRAQTHHYAASKQSVKPRASSHQLLPNCPYVV